MARLDVYWALTAGLSLWNPTIGAAYQLKHLRMALREGEPRRMGLALATEAAYRCVAGERAYAEARSLLNHSLAIAARLGDPAIAGTAQAMGGMCGWLTGRWDVARDSGLEGERTLRERCSAVSWQLSVARNAALGGLLWSGDWIEYAARLSEWTHDAEDRGDATSLSVYRMNHSPLSLAADDPAQAAADLDEAERILEQAWSERGFHVPHFFGVFGRAGVALYRGSAVAELEALEQGFRRVRGSMLLRIETIAVLAAVLEASLAIAAAPGNPALLRKARACAASLRRRRTVWSLGMAMLIEAGIAASSRRIDVAAARWADAERELSRSGMRMYAAAAQFCRGRAAGDKQLVQAADAVFRSQGVRSPERMAMSLAPGMPL